MLKGILQNKKAVTKIYIAIFSLLFIGLIVGLVMAATHDAIITITPDEANCNDLGHNFTLNIKNEIFSGADNIFEVRIYEGGSLDDFVCGLEPTGWTLSDYAGGDPDLTDYGYCEYKTTAGGSDMIEPGENVDFTFDAVMIADACSSSFTVSTLDDASPIGEHEYNFPQVDIDCDKPYTDKFFQPEGTFKIEGDIEWIDTATRIVLDPTDDVIDSCDGSGVKETKYVNILAEDFVKQYDLDRNPELPCLDLDYCQSLLDYSDRIPEGLWIPYVNPFPKAGESCHVLFYYSEDELGNTEDVKVNCFFVDKTPPIGTKTIGEPKLPMCDAPREPGEYTETFELIGDDINPVPPDHALPDEGRPDPEAIVTKTWDCDKVVWDIELEEITEGGESYDHTEFSLVIGFSDDLAEFQVGTGQMFDGGSPPMYQPCDGGPNDD